MQRLELTWIGKGEDPEVEPRILIHDPSKDYGDPDTGNMLIHGDNLLALKALEQDFSGKIKCVYIDPPYNTGNAFEHYDDNVEHSTWLNLMEPRLELLRKLLSDDGVVFISIDDDESHYLKVLCDEVFGRKNYCGSFVWERKKKPSFLSNMGVVTEYILCYAKDKLQSPPFIYGSTTKGKKYPLNNAGNGVRTITFPAGSVRFRMIDQIVPAQDMSGGNIITTLDNDVQIKNGLNVNEFSLTGEWRYSQEKILQLLKDGEEFVISKIPFRPNHVKQGGAPKKMKNLLSVAHYGMATNEDATKESEALFGNKSAFENPKPEKLIQVLLGAVTEENDFVLDSFLGSGTTAAVAQKMNRKWIGIELGDHCYTHCKPRLDKVIDGEQGGVSKELGWTGGGGYRFYELAPSLIEKDQYGNSVFSDEYNTDMLVAAVAKINGFTYEPDNDCFWKQGFSQDNSFIFVTTQYLTAAVLDGISSDLKPLERLLVCASAFDLGLDKRYDNITVRKIPRAILDKCKYGVDNYNLNVVELPTCDDEEQADE